MTEVRLKCCSLERPVHISGRGLCFFFETFQEMHDVLACGGLRLDFSFACYGMQVERHQPFPCTRLDFICHCRCSSLLQSLILGCFQDTPEGC